MKTTKASDLLNKVKAFEEADQMPHISELMRSVDDARQLHGRQTYLRLQSELISFLFFLFFFPPEIPHRLATVMVT